MRTVKSAAWLGVVLGLGACTHLPPRQPTGLRPEAVAREQAKRETMVHRIAGKVGLRIQSKDNNLSGKGRLVSQAPGDFRLELRDPLGRVQYVLAEQKEKLVAYYPRQKLAYLDAQWGRRYVKRFLGLDFSFPELRDLFVGILPARWRRVKIEGWHWDEAHADYRGSFTVGTERLSCGIDPDSGALTALELESAGGKVKVAYSDFEPWGGEGQAVLSLARVVRVELVQPPSAVEIEWQSVERLAEPKDGGVFGLSLPPDVKKEDL